MPECKHLRSRCFASTSIGNLHCVDCGTEVPMYVVIDNWLLELQRMKEGNEETTADRR